MTRQRLQLRQEPLASRAAHPPSHPPPDHTPLPATHERQGRTLPPDDGARVGLRARLPLTSTTQPRAATLAQALQHDQAAQLDRGPATDSPRSQRAWVAHLASRAGFDGDSLARKFEGESRQRLATARVGVAQFPRRGDASLDSAEESRRQRRGEALGPVPTGRVGRPLHLASYGDEFSFAAWLSSAAGD
jgi:hypothetical protein